MNGREAARRVFREFQGREPNRTIEVPGEGNGAGLGRVLEITYAVPADWPSEKAGKTYTHRFGNTGLSDTGARPLLIADEAAGSLAIKTAPGERPFETTERGIVG